MVGIETERGPWVASLVAAGYTVYALDPKSVARYRERHSTSGAKSDAADAHLMAEIVRLDRAAHRPVAGDTALAEGIKLAARSHQNLVWERTRHVLRLRSALREFYPAALTAFPAWSPMRWSCWARHPTRTPVADLFRAEPSPPRTRVRTDATRPHQEKTLRILRADELRQPAPIQAAFAAITASEAAIIAGLEHPDRGPGEGGGRPFSSTPRSILTSLPGLGVILGARLLGEFGNNTTDTSTPRPARLTPAPRRSPRPPAPERSSWPATPATNVSATQPNGGRSPQCADPPARPRTTTTPSTRHRSPSSPAATLEPMDRHPPRLPQDWHHLRRTHRLGTRSRARRLTATEPGMSAALQA